MKKMFSLFVVIVLLIPFNSALHQILDHYISKEYQYLVVKIIMKWMKAELIEMGNNT